MEENSTYVGMDDHKKSINVAVLLPSGEVVEWRIANEARAIQRMVKKLRKVAEGRVVCCYEAGPGGYVLQRRLQKLEVECQVVAPSRTPKRPGARIKTDRRDALELAKLLRGGLLEEVFPPSAEQEATREVCRCRESLQKDLTRSRQRVTQFLLRRGLSYGGGKNWTERHRRWLHQIQMEQGHDQQALDCYVWAVEQLEQQVAHLKEKLVELSEQPEYRQAVAALRCFRGIDTLTAIMLVCELYSFGRFGSPRGLMNFLGVVPGEESSGERERKMGITKTGNNHVRRLLVEAAWHYRHRPAVGKSLEARRAGQPAEVIAHADKAMLRLNRRYWRLLMRGKASPKAVVAVARELVGFLWAVLYQEQSMA